MHRNSVVNSLFESVIFFDRIKKDRVLTCRFILLAMAPKDRKYAALVHCQLVEGKIVCNYRQKEVGGGEV